MDRGSRRDFLKLGAASLPALALPSPLHALQASAKAVSSSSYRTPATLQRFVDPLPILQPIAPEAVDKDGMHFRIRMQEFSQAFHSQLPPARVWGYESRYPGPTIEARCDTPVHIRWENQLPTQHLFAVDTHLHAAMPPAPAVRTVPHVHGSRTPPMSDGLPENWFPTGHSVDYHYPNHQLPATLWYHDHGGGITRLNVYAGLTGFYLLRNQQEMEMDLPSGEYEIPMVLQDRTLDDRGQLVYAPSDDTGRTMPPGVWGPEFFGALPVVNGAVYPHLEVEPRPYRVRLVNAANTRFFRLYLNLAMRPTDIPSLVKFHQIGSDGGLLPAPVELSRLLLAPAERADLILDFSRLEGRVITVSNDAPTPYPGWDSLGAMHAPLSEIMQIRVTRPLSPVGRKTSLPAPIPFPKLDEADAVVTRDLYLAPKLDKQGATMAMYINETPYMAPVTEIVKLGSVEKWRFINTTDDSHPMHLHLVQFRILHRQSYDPSLLQKGIVRLIGLSRPPAANEAGWKDTAIVDPHEVLTILVKFDGYLGRYLYHCHVLEHADNNMMRPFEVVAADAST
jgi:spore coat protein A